MDRVAPEVRSRIMAAIRSKDTGPERTVRSLVHRLGYRFRVHSRALPGTPDIVLPRHRVIILVNGCFWHLHRCRAGRAAPRTNAAFWRAKREGNRDRDRRTLAALRRLGWRVLVLWECQLRDADALAARVERWLRENSAVTSRAHPRGGRPAAGLSGAHWAAAPARTRAPRPAARRTSSRRARSG